MEMPHPLQTEKCHDGGTGSWEAASEGRETWGIHFRREVVRNHQAEVKGLRENGQDVEDGQDPGDVGSHGPHLWDGLNMGVGGSRTDGTWDKPEEATGVLDVLLGEDGEAQGYRWPRKVVRVYQEQEGGECSDPGVGCVLCAHHIPTRCSGRNRH